MTQAINQENSVSSVAPINEAMPAPIKLTETAALKVWELLEEEGNLNLSLRAYITGGGCSGFQYGFTFDEEIKADDTVVEKTLRNNKSDENVTIKLLVDALSFQYLVGAEIDYQSDLQGERFIIRNPNAQTTCGCGSSFSA